VLIELDEKQLLELQKFNNTFAKAVESIPYLQKTFMKAVEVIRDLNVVAGKLAGPKVNYDD
jgi:hypothetical protein